MIHIMTRAHRDNDYISNHSRGEKSRGGARIAQIDRILRRFEFPAKTGESEEAAVILPREGPGAHRAECVNHHLM